MIGVGKLSSCRAYAIAPPPLDMNDERHPSKDRRYRNVPKDCLPLTECLKDTVARVIPYWHDFIAKDILDGKRVLVVAHGNSLRSIVKYLDNVSDKGFGSVFNEISLRNLGAKHPH